MKRVLIIDDEADFRHLIGEVLRHDGWEVLEAADGESGVALAKVHRPEVVLLDLLMPRGNGFRACRELRDDISLAHSKIIVTSGRDFSADHHAAKDAGADEYLAKPIDPKHLIGLLNQFSFPDKTHADRKGGAAGNSSPVRIKFWGVRGSIATPGPSTVHYGGNTSCVEVRAGNEIIILDAGTGLRMLGRALTAEFSGRPMKLTLLLTHEHWDHIQGLPFFQPIYTPHNQLHILGFEGARASLKSILSGQMESSYFPIGMNEIPANVIVEELKDVEFKVGGVNGRAFFANHPGICVGYRLTTSDGSLVYLPDNELRYQHHPSKTSADSMTEFRRKEDDKLTGFLHAADVLIMDCQYDRREYAHHVGWGHGCLEDVTELAIKAEVKKLFLFHHDPDHDDERISQMLQTARDVAAGLKSKISIEAAREGQVVELSAVARGK